MKGAVQIRTKNKITDALTVVFSAYVCFCALAHPERTAADVSAALALSVRAVVPSLFAFSVGFRIIAPSLCAMMSKMKILSRFFGVSAGGLCMMFSGLVSGFPMGAVVYSELYERGQISKEEGESLMPFCNNAGAAFLIGSVGEKMYGDAGIGAMLILCQTAASLFGIMLTKRKRKGIDFGVCAAFPETKFSDVSRAVGAGGKTMLDVCAYITFFYTLSCAIGADVHAHGAIKAAICGFFEISSGIKALSECGGFYSFLLGATVGFSGISVYMQVGGACGGDCMKYYLRGKIQSAALSGGICAALSFFFGDALAFFDMFGGRAFVCARAAYFALVFSSMCAIGICIAALFLSKNTKLVTLHKKIKKGWKNRAR